MAIHNEPNNKVPQNIQKIFEKFGGENKKIDSQEEYNKLSIWLKDNKASLSTQDQAYINNWMVNYEISNNPKKNSSGSIMGMMLEQNRDTENTIIETIREIDQDNDLKKALEETVKELDKENKSDKDEPGFMG